MGGWGGQRDRLSWELACPQSPHLRCWESSPSPPRSAESWCYGLLVSPRGMAGSASVRTSSVDTQEVPSGVDSEGAEGLPCTVQIRVVT